ncbi:MAG: MFS transporter [Ancrocorticia sp.]|uniref:MFS transporter n=1 Tax=Ancrocorticia sp. TaxID=2593684 RepID=UPI003F900B7A
MREAEPRGSEAANSPELAESEAFRLWSSKRYITWLISDTSKGLAGTLLNFAIPLLTLMVTDDPAQAGIIGGVGMGVQVTTMLAGGVLADRHSRIRLMVMGGGIGAVLSAIFAAVAWVGSLSFTFLLVMEVLLALRGGIFNTAGEAQLKSVVPASAMGRAQAANQARDAALQIAGNPIGGFLLGIGGWMIGAVMGLAHLLSAATAVILGRMGDRASDGQPIEHVEMGREKDVPKSGAAAAPDMQTAEPPLPSKPNAFSEIKEAFGWLFSRPDLRNVMFIATIVNLGFNAAITTAIYVLQQTGYTPVQIGTMSSAIGIVMLVGALVAPILVQRVGTGFLVVGGLIVLAAGVATLTVTDSLVGMVIILSIASVLIPALNSGLLGYFMVAVPTHLLGRANSAIGIMAMGATPLAPLVAGFGLSWIGRTGTIMICAGLCALAALIATSSRGVRSLPKEAGWADHAEQFA